MNKLKCLESQCPHHCCKEFDGISAKISPFENTHSFSDIFLTDEDVSELVSLGYNNLIIRTESGLSKLKTFEDGLCSALEDGKCAIYPHRPTICRAYPLYIDMFAGLCIMNDCPATSKELCCSFTDELHSIIKIYEFWIKHIAQLKKDLDMEDNQ